MHHSYHLGAGVWEAAVVVTGAVDAGVCDIAAIADAMAIIIKVEMRNEIVLLMISCKAFTNLGY